MKLVLEPGSQVQYSVHLDLPNSNICALDTLLNATFFTRMRDNWKFTSYLCAWFILQRFFSFSFFSFFFFFKLFWACHVAYRILVPRRGIEPRPTAVKAGSPNSWPGNSLLFSLNAVVHEISEDRI